MKWLDASFEDEFNVPQEYAVLIYDVRRAAVSVPFTFIVVEADVVFFSNAYFEFADKGPVGAQHGSLPNLPTIFASLLNGRLKTVFLKFCA